MNRRVTCFLLTLALCLMPSRAPAATVIGALSNFDVHNFTQEPANDFHLILRGVHCADLAGTYAPPPWIFHCQDLPNGALHVWWSTAGPPVVPCNYVHFGLHFLGNPNTRVMAAWWTRDGRPLRPYLSFANQRWEGSAECWVGDLVDGFPRLNRPQVLIDRDLVFPPVPVPLEMLTWDQVADLPWIDGPGPEVVPDNPDLTLPLPIPLPGPQQALIVRYPVFGSSPTQPDARFLNELVLTADFTPLASLVNVDIVNNTEFCANDLHVSFDGVSCQQFQQYYVPAGWTVDCLDRPDGSGCEVRWSAVDGTCVQPGGILHVGWRFGGSPQYRTAGSYWTWNGLPVPPFIDLPIQTWQGGGNVVVDIVQGFPPALVPGGVTFQREFALSGDVAVPLENLTWPETEAYGWLPADTAPQFLPPDPAVTIPFLFTPDLTANTAGLLIRYQVTDEAGNIQMRFINEALILPVAPPPPVTDLQIAVLDVTPGQAHLRLTWSPSPVQPALYHVYRLDDPMDPDSRQMLGMTMDSFFDVFYDVELVSMDAFVVTVEEALPNER